MVKLSFIPPEMGILMLPLYWVYFACFYVVYLPIYAVFLLFSPFRSKKALWRFYERRGSKTKPDLTYENPKNVAKAFEDALSDVENK